MESQKNLFGLIEQAKEKDEESARVLYEHLVDRVFPFVRFRVSSHEDARDLTQDVFIDLFTHLSSFQYKTPAQLYAYVFTIVRRKLAQYYERQKKKTDSFDEEVIGGVGGDAYVQSELRQILTSLDERSREIIELHHLSRYTFGEIGDMLGVGESAVRVAHHRVMAKLKANVEDRNTEI